MIQEHLARKGIEAITKGAAEAFRSDAIRREVEAQKKAFEDDGISGVLTEKQLNARVLGEEFIVDRERAEKIGMEKIEMSVGMRLQSAYACYKADMQMECIRCLMIAMSSICHTIGWSEAEAYLDRQSRELYELNKSN